MHEIRAPRHHADSRLLFIKEVMRCPGQTAPSCRDVKIPVHREQSPTDSSPLAMHRGIPHIDPIRSPDSPLRRHRRDTGQSPKSWRTAENRVVLPPCPSDAFAPFISCRGDGIASDQAVEESERDQRASPPFPECRPSEESPGDPGSSHTSDSSCLRPGRGQRLRQVHGTIRRGLCLQGPRRQFPGLVSIDQTAGLPPRTRQAQRQQGTHHPRIRPCHSRWIDVHGPDSHREMEAQLFRMPRGHTARTPCILSHSERSRESLRGSRNSRSLPNESRTGRNPPDPSADPIRRVLFPTLFRRKGVVFPCLFRAASPASDMAYPVVSG